MGAAHGERVPARPSMALPSSVTVTNPRKDKPHLAASIGGGGCRENGRRRSAANDVFHGIILWPLARPRKSWTAVLMQGKIR